ncbi:MAG: PGPGW domain-containing protein [Actinobacteria bacterium]|nr:PGPGW domain-containing protein [Actinomycetota bacterium]MBU1494367.1 PGPGW domain-containing protein [Actinomycetota bacterium]MBU1866168.1 PGPGW domain-containing protein [Actinomycetota bacterium]
MADRRRMSMRRVGVGMAGWLVVGIGVILMPLPGPGTVLVLGGLSLLQHEYPWAGRVLRRLRARTGVLGRWIKTRPTSGPPD